MSSEKSLSSAPFSISINGKDPSEVSGQEQLNELKEYIIQHNNRLQQQYSEVLEKNQLLTQELTEKEAELDKEEERLRYVKGILNNLNEVRKLALKANEQQSEKYHKSMALMKRVMDIEQTIYRHLILFSKIMTAFLILNCVYKLYLWKDFSSFIYPISFMWTPMLILNVYYSYITKKEKFDIFKCGHYKLIEDLNLFQKYSFEQDQKIKKSLEELKEIEEANLSLEHWIADT